MPQPIYAFAITAPFEGSEVEIIRWGETQVSSSGLLVEVQGPFRIGDQDQYDCSNMLGEKLQIVHLQNGADLDWETREIYRLLGGDDFSMPPEGAGEEGNAFPIDLIRRILSAIVKQVKQHPFPAIGILFMLAGAILYFFGYTEAGRYLIDVGMKFLLMIGATMAVLFVGFKR